MSATEETKKKGKGWKRLIIFISLLELGGIITALVFIISNSGANFDLDGMMTGVYIIWGVGGSFPIIFVPIMILGFLRRRTSTLSTVQSFKMSKIGPYAPGYKPTATKIPRFCDFCGYEVVAGERECPECGGPIKNIKRSYIT